MTKHATSKPPHRVAVLAYDGLCTFEYGIAVEVFGAAWSGDPAPPYTVATVAGEPGALHAQGGLTVTPGGGLELLEDATTVIVPGWRRPHHQVPGRLAEALAAAHRRGARMVSICGGAYVLAAAGLLAGRRATTHWRLADDFARRHPGVVFEANVLYVDEGDILTSAGSAAGIDLCLHLVRRDLGPQAANAIACGLVVPPHRGGGQAQFVRRPVASDGSARLAELLDWMRASLDQDLSLDRLSRRAGLAPRTFLRRFSEATGMTPAEWVTAERLAHACDLLETTRLGMEEIAAGSGFGSAATLRHHFRRRLSTTPTLYRAQFAR
ncbi:transcriptional regulator FtrA [Roseospirillum parvum]|nr:transcriptional regulator FtrA [Roseospirillum parvum]